jgi:hypothetical protein
VVGGVDGGGAGVSASEAGADGGAARPGVTIVMGGSYSYVGRGRLRHPPSPTTTIATTIHRIPASARVVARRPCRGKRPGGGAAR